MPVRAVPARDVVGSHLAGVAKSAGGTNIRPGDRQASRLRTQSLEITAADLAAVRAVPQRQVSGGNTTNRSEIACAVNTVSPPLHQLHTAAVSSRDDRAVR